MSRYPFWAVLTPGGPAWLESRARAIVMTEWDIEDGKEAPFELVLGHARYHAIVGMDPMDVGAEMQLAEALSFECDEPVYSIERANDPWTVMSWRHGALEVLDDEPEALAKSLGCPLPGSEESSVPFAKSWLRTAALVEGIPAQEVCRVLEERFGRPLAPGHYYFEDTLRGTLITDGKYELSYAYVDISERLPRTTVYGVSASSDLSTFSVTMLRAGECLGEFSRPPDEGGLLPPVSDIEGERSPERILAVLGIPVEWFLND